MEKSLKLIALYLHICESYEAELQWEVQRFSFNGQKGQITDRSEPSRIINYLPILYYV